MSFLRLMGASVIAVFASGQQPVSFPTEDGGIVFGDLYGKGSLGVVLAHGGRFNKGSWAPQARALAEAGFRVLAIDFRRYRPYRAPAPSNSDEDGTHLDVLAAVRYLRKHGVRSVSIVGGSFGGDAAALASVVAKPGEIDRLVLLANGGIAAPERMQGRKLFITARDDLGPRDVPRLVNIRKQYERAAEPKELLILEGSAHAQFLFQTEHDQRLMREILRFLTAP